MAESLDAPRVPAEKRRTRAVIPKGGAQLAARRQKWAEEKRRERAKWSGQKWRRHRERILQNYYDRKASKKPSVSTWTGW